MRQMRDQGVKAPLMGGDGITADEFASIAGPGAEGTLMTYGPDPRKRPEAKAVVEKFRAKKFEPEAYTLYSYAAVQIIKQAAEAAKSLDPKKVAEKMQSGMKFKTVIGDISYDKKGDVTRLDYVMYVWKKDADGKITYVEIPSPAARDCNKRSNLFDAKAAMSRLAPAALRMRCDRSALYPILPSAGNASSSQKLAWLTQPVRKAMPVSTRSAPITFSTAARWREARQERRERLDREGRER